MKKLLITDDSQSWVKHHNEMIKQLFGDKYQIDTAYSAKRANEMIYLNEEEPYDVILTDMQMESDFLPLFAGEWLIEQIQNFPKYFNCKIVICSAAQNIKMIAQKYNVDYIPKYACKDKNSYFEIFKNF
jgi:response regulator of citrate/malate metabolism